MDVIRLIVGGGLQEIARYREFAKISPDDKRVFAVVGCQSLRGMRIASERIGEVIILPKFERLHYKERIHTMEQIEYLGCPVYYYRDLL